MENIEKTEADDLSHYSICAMKAEKAQGGRDAVRVSQDEKSEKIRKVEETCTSAADASKRSKSFTVKAIHSRSFSTTKLV